jgi:uncharacterized protein
MTTRVFTLACLASLLLGCGETGSTQDAGPTGPQGPSMRIHYLEIVTPDVEATCATYARLHGVAFGRPVPELGNARTANLRSGARVGVRTPLRDTEEPVVRPYLLVDDIAASVKAADAAGAQIALPPTELPGQGTCAIYVQGGIQHGLWQRQAPPRSRRRHP